MKLKNKRTGEIVMICKINPEPYEAREFECSSLAELNEEWEDYEEPSKYYYVDDRGAVFCEKIEEYDHIWHEARRAIGNYFETKEEAEKAVEKLKAWKRLKDKGFKYKGHYMPKDVTNIEISVSFENAEYVDIMNDLDLLFGGEE